MHIHRDVFMLCMDRKYILASIGTWYLQIDKHGIYINH